MASPVNTGSVFSPAPIRTNFLNPDGSVSDIWVRWLNSLYNHVASTTPNTSTSILDVQLQSIMDGQSVPIVELLTAISDLQKQVTFLMSNLGVTSLNGLTGDLTLISAIGTISISEPDSQTIKLSTPIPPPSVGGSDFVIYGITNLVM